MERAERTMGSWAAEPCENGEVSGEGETSFQVTPSTSNSFIEAAQLLIFLDQAGEIKGAIKGRDEIKRTALHACRKKHLQSL